MAIGKAEMNSKLSARITSGSKETKNLFELVSCKLLAPMSAFSCHIDGVILSGSSKQMIGVYTSPIVTFMKNAKTIWNLANVKLITYAMSKIKFFVYFNSSISVSCFMSNPVPAIFSFNHFFKEPFVECHTC